MNPGRRKRVFLLYILLYVYYLNILFSSAGQLEDDFIYYIGISPLFDKGVFEINQGFQHLRAFFIR